jgi:hypothetical protein
MMAGVKDGRLLVVAVAEGISLEAHLVKANGTAQGRGVEKPSTPRRYGVGCC